MGAEKGSVTREAILASVGLGGGTKDTSAMDCAVCSSMVAVDDPTARGILAKGGVAKDSIVAQ